jgi:sulfotransferase famil protein
MMTAMQAFETNYNIHISEEFNFVFFNNPKAGCSTTKATLNLACAARLGIDLRYREMSNIHARAYNILKSPKQLGAERAEQMINDPNVVRFCVLREPVSRIASAYASKFRGNSPQRQRLNAFLERPADYAWPDINEFVAALASDTAIRDFDPHWRSQYLQVGAAHVDMTLVGFQEELEAGLRKFARLVFGAENIEIFDAREHFRHNVSKSAVSMDSLTPESLRLLHEAYAEDFSLYRREWARMHPGVAVPTLEDQHG